ncbi:MAG: ATP-binding protein [Bacteroidales bacterium]|nr:ATP-binding protein [Bacteroidales bacterium]
MIKDVIKSLIIIKQSEIPFDVTDRDVRLPIDGTDIITTCGVRRCGKSTMMEIAINDLVAAGVSPKNILWVGFDDERLVNMSSNELDEVLMAYMEMFPETPIKNVYMFFDEIQLIENWEYFVLRVYKSYCRHIFISGSNTTMLSSELSSALRGYPLEYRQYPLSFNEYCRFTGVPTSGWTEQDHARLRVAFEQFNRECVFPKVVLTGSKSEKVKLTQSYFNTMLLKDLAEHYKIRNTALLRYFVKRIMNSLTKPVSINSIYNDIRSQGYKTAKDELYSWAEYICNVFMFICVPKYDRSLARQRSSLDKFYFIDNGLRSMVVLSQNEDRGKNLENTVLLQLERFRPDTDTICYYQGKCECDFVVQREDTVMQLIQVSWSISDSATCSREIAGLLEASTATGCGNLMIITADEEDIIRISDKKISVVPAWKWLLGK